jgi:archaemetzincin
LGTVNVDIFVPELNFVFGEAECPGKATLISLWRLRPEFHGKAPNMDLFLERITKEAVHELGHALGLRHCANPFCVMYFSNSIFETDRKQSLFCTKCNLKAETAVNNLG